MKLCNIKNIEGFFNAINKCKGKITLVSEDLSLNLKSELSKYFALAKLFSEGTEVINEIEVICSDPDDTKILMQFMLNGE